MAQLFELAVENSQRLTAMQRAIATREQTLWTESMPRVSIGQNLLAEDFGDGVRASMSLNLVEWLGGGERARAQLAIADLETRRAEFETGLRLEIIELLYGLQQAKSVVSSLERKHDTTELAFSLYEQAYRGGGGDTVQYFEQEDARVELEQGLCEANNRVQLARAELVAVVNPAGLAEMGWSGCR